LPTNSRQGPAWTGVAMASKPTEVASIRTSPRGSRVWASLSVAYQAVPVCWPFSYSEKVKLNATSAWASSSLSMLNR
jgi:hypothetical protein